jgi:inosine-uridine nucleoside N-ribohydrolase
MRLRQILLLGISTLLMCCGPARARQGRKIIIDEDTAGPATTNLQAVLALVQSPQTQVLGVTVVTGDQWRDEEVAHALRLLEIIGRTDIPVVPGAVFPLDNRPEFMAQWQKLHGRIDYMGAWKSGVTHPPSVVPPLAEGSPATKPSIEDAAHFMIRMVRRYPHQVTIYAGGPLTDIASAVTIDPQFASMTQGLVVMGGSIDPQTSDAEFREHPRSEFNFRMDPEAAHAVLMAHWPRITVTPVDISVQTRLTTAMIVQIGRAKTPAARYIARYAVSDYMWDELAAIAWLDPGVVTGTQQLYLDVSIDPGANYGDTLVWQPGHEPALNLQRVTVNVELDKARFYRDFVQLMTSPTPAAHSASGPPSAAASSR